MAITKTVTFRIPLAADREGRAARRRLRDTKVKVPQGQFLTAAILMLSRAERQAQLDWIAAARNLDLDPASRRFLSTAEDEAEADELIDQSVVEAETPKPKSKKQARA